MKDPNSAPSVDAAIERIKERLRQERETFNQHKAHENRWFVLRLVMGYSAVIFLLAVMVISSYILLNNASFPNTVVVSAGAALFVDTLGLLISIWKIVFNPDFMTKLAPTTILENSESGFLSTPPVSSSNKNDLAIFFAKYGAQNGWIDVAPILRARIQEGKLQINVTNEELGSDPTRGVVKNLEVVYSYSGQTYSKTVPEHATLLLPD